ncbi:MAG: DUF2339 domain-containing protein [Phycisphaerales bacterium]|nr:MAG: DUF2339 domain-containing protein [Phycisphaerales bacterium]
MGSEDELKRRLEELEARLERLERQLEAAPAPGKALTAREEVSEKSEASGPADVAGTEVSLRKDVAPEKTPPAPPLVTPEMPRRPIEKPEPGAPPVEPPPVAKPTPPPPPVAPPITPAAAPPSAAREKPAAPPPVAPTKKPAAPAAAPVRPPRVREPRGATPSTRPLEMLIGIKVAAWVGAIIIVFGGAFAVKLGIDAGIWGRMSEELRCLLVAGFGALLLIGGEVALRKIGKAASAGLYSAGLGVVYLDAFATFQWFELLSKEWAFVLMGVVAVLGFAITVRTKFLTIGVLSLIGGYLTPILLRGSTGHDLELLCFLTVLLAIALGLSSFQPRHFRPLRYLALGGQALLGLLWVIPNGARHWEMAIFFMSLWWGMVLVESLIAAVRRQSAIGNVLATLLTTAAYVTCGCWILNDIAPPTGFDWLGIFTAAIGVLSAAAALQFGPGLDGLRGQLRNAMDKLAVALWAQFGVLIAVAIGLQFDDAGQAIGWIALALGSIEIGRRLPSRGVDLFGLIVGALASGWVVLMLPIERWISAGSTLFNTLFVIGEIEVTGWSLLALGAILVTCLAAHRLRGHGDKPWRVMPIILTAAATAGWFGLSVVLCVNLTLTGAWLVGVIILLALQRIGTRQRYVEIALVALLVIASKWVLIDVVAERIEPNWRAGQMMPVLNWQMGLAVAIAICAWWGIRLMRLRSAALDIASRGIGAGRQVAIIAAMLFLLIALSFEVDRLIESMAAGQIIWSVGHVKNLSLTMLWAFGAIGAGLLSFMLRQPDESGQMRTPALLTQFAWGLLLLLFIKWIVIDTLFWTLSDQRSAVLALNRIMNLQMLVGVVLVVAAVLLMFIARPVRALVGAVDRDRTAVDQWEVLARWTPVLGCLLVLWGLSFEIDRLIGRLTPEQVTALKFEPALLRALWWTALWAVGGMVMIIWGKWRQLPSMIAGGWVLIAVTTVAWLTFDTLGWRLTHAAVDATIVLNLQFGVGALAAILLAVLIMLAKDEDVYVFGESARITPVSLGLIAALGLWLGSFEIDRVFLADAMKVQTGLSVYWSLYAVMLITVGFLRRSAAVRYAGLALLAITVLKVLIIDMKDVEQIWRVISFTVSGLLMVGTSVLYAKLSPRVLQSLHGPPPEGRG